MSIESFKELNNKGKNNKELADTLYQMFCDLDQDVRQEDTRQENIEWNIYAGNDEEHKQDIAKFFGGTEAIYGSMEPNAIVNQIHARLLQPFYKNDDLVTFSPTGNSLEVVERTQSLINQQLKEEHFLTELDKIVKTSLINKVGYLEVGWESKTIVSKKRVIRRELTTDPNTGEQSEIIIPSEEDEEILIEKPDFRVLRNSDVLHPKVERWEDVPYVITLRRMSKYHFNRRFIDDQDEINGSLNHLNTTRTSTELDDTLNKIPATNLHYGDKALNEVHIANFYFSDGTLIIAQLYPQMVRTGKESNMQYTSLRVLEKTVSPIPGRPIPIHPLVIKPVPGRFEGESIINVCKFLARKITEFDQHHLQALRDKALEPTFVDASLDLPVKDLENRKPRAYHPVQLQGDDIRRHIFKGTQEPVSDVFLASREQARQTMNQVTGVNDFFVGNLGKSARLTGVESLLGNALAQLAPGLVQINKFIKEVIESLLLLNRAYLPKQFIENAVSLHVPSSIESFEIPYPLQATINTSVDGGGDKSIKMGILFQLLELALRMEQVQPGTFDVNGILLYAFTQGGVPEIKRFLLKSPFTKEEKEIMQQMEQLLRLQQQSSFANTENPFGQPVQQAPQPGQAGGFDPTGQSQAAPAANEMRGQSI